jgi:hypothetical protein
VIGTSVKQSSIATTTIKSDLFLIIPTPSLFG